MPVENVGFTAIRNDSAHSGTLSAEAYTGETTLQDYAYAQLRRWLEGGNLQSGDRIKEVVVARALDISRVPVREAVLRLQSEGFLKSLAKGGYIVPRYTARDVCDLYEMREAIEGMSARLAVERASDSAIFRIREFNDRMREIYALKSSSNLSDFYIEHANELNGLDNDFHRGILRAGKNPYALKLISQMSSQLISISRMQVVGGDKLEQMESAKEDRTVDVHQAIIEALLERDADKAECVVREHIRATRLRFEDLAKFMSRSKTAAPEGL